uniref:Uncharacterized protein n=1 Tax=Arundo donax TaxID=35708 RepID=A0A0A9F9F8_ARUDO
MLRRTTAPTPSYCGRARNLRTTCRGFSIDTITTNTPIPSCSGLLGFSNQHLPGRACCLLCASKTTMASPYIAGAGARGNPA